jgi:Reverse transcriptase (RNA-dependent DNA polymerase)
LVNEAFVVDALAQLQRTGAIKEVPPEDVLVVSPLGVVGDPDKKARLILDAMYINAFDKYVPFHYESLRDIPILADPADVVLITDFKSGYHHIPLHPTVKYFGIRFQGRTYCFTVLPFGLASACRVFTEVMLEIWRPLRERGVRSILYIDDIMSFFRKGLVALVGRALILSVLAFLNWFLSIEKCVFTLPVEGKMLGLWCNVQHGFFKVPSDKAQAILHQLDEFLTIGGTKRDLAKLAGKLISIAPAIQLAPLYTRRLFQAMGDVATWDSALGEEQVTLAEEDLRYFQAALQLNAGWRWSPRVNVQEFSCAGDASETGYGGHSALLPADMVLPFDARDQARLQAGQLSSTLREVKNACFLISTCLQHNPDKLQGGTLVCYCDNQGAVANMNKMRGSPEEVTVIRDMWVLATALDVQIRVEWRPRESAVIAVKG